jgi:ArsR family transcriptional regulator, lead/cadmium/zinc/bismuth-responsive transcriptional repressor
MMMLTRFSESQNMKAVEPSQVAAETRPCNILHPITVRKVSKHMPAEADLNRLAEFFKIFSDKTRVGILWALSLSEMCVCDLSMLLKMKQPAISQQLKSLRQMRIVRSHRDGKVVYYTLDDEHIRTVLDFGLRHVQES